MQHINEQILTSVNTWLTYRNKNLRHTLQVRTALYTERSYLTFSQSELLSWMQLSICRHCTSILINIPQKQHCTLSWLTQWSLPLTPTLTGQSHLTKGRESRHLKSWWALKPLSSLCPQNKAYILQVSL